MKRRISQQSKDRPSALITISTLKPLITCESMRIAFQFSRWNRHQTDPSTPAEGTNLNSAGRILQETDGTFYPKAAGISSKNRIPVLLFSDSLFSKRRIRRRRPPRSISPRRRASLARPGGRTTATALVPKVLPRQHPFPFL